MTWLTRDTALRRAAFSHLAVLVHQYSWELPWSAIEQGFPFQGRSQHFASKAEGIYKPAGHPAALSIKTIVPRSGRSNPYQDELASSDGVFRYSYKARGGPDNAANSSLRAALQRRLPLIWFWGLEPGLYTPIFPVYVVADSRERRLFHVAPGALAYREPLAKPPALLGDAPDKRYAAVEVRQRLHQRQFRAMVLAAYRNHCAMCSLHYPGLIEAAHILPDRDERGRPEVSNGMALCALHHEAYDRFLIDVAEDYTIQLSPRMKRERDGPIFEKAFLERDGEPILLPRSHAQRPDPYYLRERARLRPRHIW